MRGKILLYFSLLLFCFIMLPDTVFATSSVSFTDSILQKARQLPDSSRLVFLQEQATIHQIEPDYNNYLEAYITEATKLNDKRHLAEAYNLRGIHYYMSDEVKFLPFLHEIEPFLLENNFAKELIYLKSLNVYLMIRNGKSQEVFDGIEEMKALSEKMNYPEGLTQANQNLANFYFTNNMLEDGERIYLDILKNLEQNNAPLSRQIGILVQLFTHVPSTSANKMKYLKEAEERIKEFKAKRETLPDKDFTIYMYDFSVHFTYAGELIKQDRMDEALSHIREVEELVDEYKMGPDRRIGIDQLYLDYYKKLAQKTTNISSKNNYLQQSLIHLDHVIDLARNDNMPSALSHYLNEKADLYYELERYKEVIDIQKEVMALNDTINQNKFSERLAEMHTLYNVDKLEFEKQQIELTAQQTQNRMVLWIAGCIFLILIITSLIFWIRVAQKGKNAMARAKEKAEEADQMKSVFLANMNHEIRTPLNAIVGFSQIIAEEEDAATRQEYSKIIESNNELLQRLIGDVLDISKIESDTLSLFYSEHDLSVMMKDIYNMLSLRVPPQISLILDSCEPFILNTDRNRLIQVITNLLTNAVKHTSQGHIRFGYSETNGKVHFYVEDTGEGIPEAQQETIFNRFTQLENGKKGVGLGLAISKGIITKMGGEIWVESIEGSGSIFHVIIPVGGI